MMAIADDCNSGDSGGEGDGDGGGGCGGGGCSGGQGIGQCKQLRRRQKLTIKYKKTKNGKKSRTEFWQRLSVEDGDAMAMATVSAKSMAEGDGRWRWLR